MSDIAGSSTSGGSAIGLKLNAAGASACRRYQTEISRPIQRLRKRYPEICPESDALAAEPRYTNGMTHKVGIKGQVVIPKAIRDEIGIKPGDEVTFEPDGSEVRVRRVNDDPERCADEIRILRGLWVGAGGGTEELLQERRRERDAEERKAQGWGVDRPR